MEKTFEEYAEAIKKIMLPAAMTAYAHGRKSAIFQEYLNMGLTEDEAQKAYSANITPDMMRAIIFSEFKLIGSSSVSPRYQIPVSETKKELPKPKRRKNRLRL